MPRRVGCCEPDYRVFVCPSDANPRSSALRKALHGELPAFLSCASLSPGGRNDRPRIFSSGVVALLVRSGRRVHPKTTQFFVWPTRCRRLLRAAHRRRLLAHPVRMPRLRPPRRRPIERTSTLCLPVEVGTLVQLKACLVRRGGIPVGLTWRSGSFGFLARSRERGQLIEPPRESLLSPGQFGRRSPAADSSQVWPDS